MGLQEIIGMGLKQIIGAALVSLGLSGAPPEQPFDTSGVPEGVRDIVTPKNIRECIERATADDGTGNYKEVMFKGRVICEYKPGTSQTSSSSGTPGELTMTFLTASDVHRPESERHDDRMEVYVKHAIPTNWGDDNNPVCYINNPCKDGFDMGNVRKHWSRSNRDEGSPVDDLGYGYTKAAAIADNVNYFETTAEERSVQMMRRALRRLSPSLGSRYN